MRKCTSIREATNDELEYGLGVNAKVSHSTSLDSEVDAGSRSLRHEANLRGAQREGDDD